MPRTVRRLALPWVATAAIAPWLAGCGSGISLDEPIEGPAWRLVQLGDQAVAPGNDPQHDPQLQFDNSGRVSGSGGCNRVAGQFVRNGGSLRISQLAETRMACADPARGATEAQFLQALQTTTGYRLSGSRLLLLDATGHTQAVLASAGGR